MITCADAKIKDVARVTRAIDPFRRYTREPKHEVRTADVTGQSYQEQVKKAREMLRSLDPEAVKQVIEFHKGLNLFQALVLAKREGKLIVPNGIHDRILTETKDPEERSSLGDRDRRSRDEQYLRQNYPAWTGTLVIYEAPDKPFGEQVVFNRDINQVKYSISFKVPKQFRGKKNCVLVVEHPDFELVDLGKNKYQIRVTDGIHLIEQFPKKDGWHMPDAETGIPCSMSVRESLDSRSLWRLDSSYLGLLRRGVLYGLRRVVNLGEFPSNRLGVALVPLATALEKSDSHD